MTTVVRSHFEWQVHQKAFALAMELFEFSKSFPKEETYSLTDQMRRSSRSVAANLAEAWRKRRYRAAFLAKLADAEGEAAETQTWVAFAVKSGFLDRDRAVPLHEAYEEVLRMIVATTRNPGPWLLGPT